MISTNLKADMLLEMARVAMDAYEEGSWQQTRLRKIEMMATASLDFGSKFVTLTEEDLALFVKPE